MIFLFADLENLVKLILDERPDQINVKNDDGETPLFLTSLSNGKFSFGKFKMLKTNAQKISFQSFFFVKLGSEDLIDYLVNKGADVNAKDNSEKTSLHWLAVFGKLHLKHIQKPMTPDNYISICKSQVLILRL